MNHPEIDPSLCTAEPALDTLEDGFAPAAQPPREQPQEPPPAADAMLPPKSPF